MKSLTTRIYRYVVRYDTGSAPNPFGGWCSLAICKPRIRSSARVGDWVIGLRSRAPASVIYVMQVREVLQFATYWSDARFAAKKPEQCRSSDNIYKPYGEGTLIQVPNGVHGAGDIVRDISSPNVLVSQRFWYFGANSPELSTDLIHLAHAGVGHTYKGYRDDDLEHLARWLGPWSTGVHGQPIDAGTLGVSLGDLAHADGASSAGTCTSVHVPASMTRVARPKC